MPVEISIELSPSQAADENYLKKAIAHKLNIKVDRVGEFRIIRKSIDARKANIKVNLGVRVFDADEEVDSDAPVFNYQDVRNAKPVVIVGAGPAGLFAALRLIELGLKPILIERGKQVSDRKRDIASLSREHNLNPDSNYAFGEGGAGTFSDGKLYTRSKKRGDFKRVLYSLYNHGADEDILYEAHPHIGTNKLPRVITKIRETITEHGGEFYFNSRVERIQIRNEIAIGVKLVDGQIINGVAVILATGHSAKDIYKSLVDHKIEIEAKPFAMGVRVEHPQELIDSIQYHGAKRDEYLPAAIYNLVHQVNGRGVYSFCMCPGGFIVPAATSPGEVVVNGMSPSMRNSRFANSGIVVEVKLEDLSSYSKHGVLAGLEFQNDLELLAGRHGASGVKAPAQRLVDFVEGKNSSSLPICSYHPGVTPSSMHEWLPDLISKRLQIGFTEFGKKMRGFLTNEALILGVESRTSSPVRIPRNPETLQHIRVKGLFPSGEGAGYAGGIVSSAVDGERCAEGVASYLNGYSS
ncbi:MAG: FAD-binding protein [Bacteroidales bacterium]|nr:MAG: FAD-binding protein [Bacteroidales bacterium]